MVCVPCDRLATCPWCIPASQCMLGSAPAPPATLTRKSGYSLHNGWIQLGRIM
uniref:Uncharacterized protein n=1 Tax=Anguilla anguilla TaxID=7936 RepID=A0A0E9RS05_ANGAN